jgi:coenzyme F420-dependent glucose-6-phosphate dehydrogenase
MGIAEAVKGVLWARRRQPDQVAYVCALGHELFPPGDLLRQAVEAEQAGFDGIACSDHLTPWWDPEQTPAGCANAWVWLGAAGQVTQEVSLGTAVTGLAGRYNPVVMAQQIATLEAMCPGRAFLGVGTSEAMNEIPAGVDWPSPGEALRRIEEALTIVTRLLDGETVTFHGEHFRCEGARLYLSCERRPPVYMSAFGPQAAAIAGRLADGVWTLADPVKAPQVIGAYRRSCEEASREPGEIIVQGLMAWAEDDDAAFESTKMWKPTQVDGNYTEPRADPVEIGRTGEEIGDAMWKAAGVVSSDPKTHVRKIKAIQALGATVVALMNVGEADPHGTLRVYGEEVLPALRQG